MTKITKYNIPSNSETAITVFELLTKLPLDKVSFFIETEVYSFNNFFSEVTKQYAGNPNELKVANGVFRINANVNIAIPSSRPEYINVEITEGGTNGIVSFEHYLHNTATMRHYSFHIFEMGKNNIMKKAIPNGFPKGIEGLGVNPLVLTIKR